MVRYALQGLKQRYKLMLAIAVLMPLVACGDPQPEPTPSPGASEEVTPSKTPKASETSPAVNPTTPSPIATPETGTTVTEEKGKLQVYWLSGSDSAVQLKGTLIPLADPGQKPEAQIQAAMDQLIKGPDTEDVASEIPKSTTLKQVVIKSDGIHVDLSSAFTEGGGSVSMQGRLGQVIYTASSLDPAQPVWISIEGKPLTLLGGEGLEVAQPMTRSQFQESFTL